MPRIPAIPKIEDRKLIIYTAAKIYAANKGDMLYRDAVVESIELIRCVDQHLQPPLPGILPADGGFLDDDDVD